MTTAGDITDALLSFLKGKYPENEELFALELKEEAVFRGISEKLGVKIDEIRDSIRSQSRERKADLDAAIGIYQEQLKSSNALKDSERYVHQLVEKSESLFSDLTGLVSQQAALKEKKTFVSDKLTYVKLVRQTVLAVESVEKMQKQRRFWATVPSIVQAEASLNEMRSTATDSKIAEFCMERWSKVRRRTLDELLNVCYEKMYADNQKVSVPKEIDFHGQAYSLTDVFQKLSELHETDTVLKRFGRVLLEESIPSILQQHAVEMDGDALIITNQSMSGIRGLSKLVEFLSERLPSPMVQRLASEVLPSLSATLLAEELPKGLPMDIDDLIGFDVFAKDITEFETVLRRYQWTQDDDFTTWISHAPKLWMSQKRDEFLSRTRDLMATIELDTKVVEMDELVPVEEDMQLKFESERLREPEREEKEKEPVVKSRAGPAKRKKNRPKAVKLADDEWDEFDQQPTETSVPVMNEPKTPEAKLQRIKRHLIVTTLPEQLLAIVSSIRSQHTRLLAAQGELASRVSLKEHIPLVLSLYRAMRPVVYTDEELEANDMRFLEAAINAM